LRRRRSKGMMGNASCSVILFLVMHLGYIFKKGRRGITDRSVTDELVEFEKQPIEGSRLH
jgi:hypothetical protein